MSTDLLPRGWTRRVRSSVLQATSLATAVLTAARARASSQDLRAQLKRAEQEVALLREGLDLKDSRWIRLSSRRRPHYTPVQRMRILVPLADEVIGHELGLCAVWYNEHRPSQALGGRTPLEVYEGLMPASRDQRIEPRSGWPANGGTDRMMGLRLVVSDLEGREHLPVVELREPA